jgi:hypothetical protein
MNKRESAIIMAFTGIGFGGKLFNDFHKYAEEKFGHPIWTHEMADEKFWAKLKELSASDFAKLAENIKD